MRTEEEKLKRKEREAAVTVFPNIKKRFQKWCITRDVTMKDEGTKALLYYMAAKTDNINEVVDMSNPELLK